MPLYLLIAQSPVPPGSPDRAVMNYPGTADQLLAAVAQQQMLPLNVRYAAHPLPHNDPSFVVLCEHIVSPPVTSRAAVNGGMGSPQGMRGHDRPEGQRDISGFQPLSDAAMGGMQDNVYGEAHDGTYNDMIYTPQGLQEAPRQRGPQ